MLKLKSILLSVLAFGLSLVAMAQTQGPGAEVIYSGKVTDQSGAPLVGASIMKSSETLSGTVTDADGKWTLSARKGETLTFSFLGFLDQTRVLGDNTTVNVKLSEDMNLLSDAVVVGYGVQKKVNITGSVSVIDGEMLNSRPVTNAVQAIQGADPSLNISMKTGNIEGNNYDISVRGKLSLNSGSPLILVDGIEADLSTVNPNDIESISVLKDASSCAIYGAKASAGVILVNTKSGVDGKTSITYNGRASFSQNTTTTDFVTSSWDYIQYLNPFYQNYKKKNPFTYTEAELQIIEARRYDVTENPERPWVLEDVTPGHKWLYAANFDWYNFLFKKTRPETEHNITVRGGNKKVNYFISGRYIYREGLFNQAAADKYNGFNLRSKVNIEVTNWLHLDTNINFDRTNYSYGGYWLQDGSEGYAPSEHGMMYNISRNVSPMFTPYNPDGTINSHPYYMTDNVQSPLGSGRITTLLDDRLSNVKKTNNLTITNRLTFDLLPNKELKLIADYTYRRFDRTGAFRCLPTPNCYDNNANQMRYGDGIHYNGAVYDFYDEQRSYRDGNVVNAYFQYNHSFGGNHNLGVTIGGNYDNYRTSRLEVKQKGSLSENLAFINANQGEIEVAQESNSAYATLGFFGRINYDYKGRYLVELSGRYDGTSRFPKGSRWGFFPSASAGWRISEEPFFSPIKSWWNNAKLRFSYGSLGNQQVSNYYYFQTISTNNFNYTFDHALKGGAASVSSPVSSGLTWETVNTYNLGLDLEFLQGRLYATTDLFIRDTKNMLTKALTLPDVYGASVPKSNAADLRTQGYEITVGWKDTRTVAGKPFSYDIVASFGDNITTITRYENPDKLLSDHYVGERLGEIWGYRVEGLFKTDEEAAAYQAQINDKNVNQGVYKSVAPNNKLMAGDVKFIDKNGDNKINSGDNTVNNPGDMEILGNSLPRYSYSLRAGFNWMGIDFSIFFQGIGKIDWMPNGDCNYFWGGYAFERPAFVTSQMVNLSWSETNSDSYLPRPRARESNLAQSALNVATDRYLQDASYCRLKNITLGYTLPIKNNRAIQKCRFYFSGENLAYFSKLKKHTILIDPEVATNGADTDCLYPYSKTFTFGIDITF